MKNVSVILKTVLTIAVIAIITLQFSSCNDNKSNGSVSSDNPTGDKSEIVANKDIAYVQLDSLINSYDMYHDLRGEFEKKANQMETEFTAKGRSFQREVADFQEKASKGLITRSQAEQMQQSLERKQADLEQTGQQMRAELAEQEAVMSRQIVEAIQSYIKKYNEDKKYSLILNNSSILYGHESMDITGDVLKGINEEYIQNRSKRTTATTNE